MERINLIKWFNGLHANFFFYKGTNLNRTIKDVHFATDLFTFIINE